MPEPVESANQPEIVNLSQADVESVTAERVHLHQANAETIQSDDVEMNFSAAGMVNAQRLSAQRSVIGGVNAESVEVVQGAVGGVRAALVNAQGNIGAVAGESVTLEGARVGVAAAREVRGGRVESVFLFAGRVEGEVHTTVDTRGAILAGLIGGLFAGLILLVGRIAFRRG